uniref:FI18412p1 (inferred by orthology to a D. melanogaster protein) n=1 Tax=Strongyloides venezuelensis TaxID=75913 RepID=A0A0K0G510_STRVS
MTEKACMNEEKNRNFKNFIYNQEEFEKEFLFNTERTNFWTKLYLRILCFNNFLNLKNGSISDIIPVVKWITNYKKGWLFNDIYCGIILGIISIPQIISCCYITSTDTINGLHTSLFSSLFYTFLGSSKHTSLGMFFISPILIINVKHNLQDTLEDYENEFDIITDEEILSTITFTCGIIMLIFYMCNFHFLLDYFSDPVIKGFTSGTALKVLILQLPKLLGLKIEKKKNPFSYFNILFNIREKIDETNLGTFILSISSLSFLFIAKFFISPLLLKRFGKVIPFELIFIIISTIVVYSFSLNDAYDIEVVGEVQNYLPSPTLPNFSIIPNLLIDATIIALTNYVILNSISKYFSKKYDYSINANQEVRAMAFIYIMTSFFNCYPSEGSLSRSNILAEYNAKSQLHSFISSLTIIFTIFLCNSILKILPKCILSIILTASTFELISQLQDVHFLFNRSPIDCIIWISTFLITFIFDTPYSLILGVLFSLLTIILRLQYPKVTFLGNIKKVGIYKNIEEYEMFCDLPSNIQVIHFNLPLLYLNIEKFYEITSNIIEIICVNCRKSIDNNFNDNLFIQFIILDCSEILFIDHGGVKAIEEFFEYASKIGITVYFSTCNDELIRVLDKFEIFKKISKSNFFLSTSDAVEYCKYLMLKVNEIDL